MRAHHAPLTLTIKHSETERFGVFDSDHGIPHTRARHCVRSPVRANTKKTRNSCAPRATSELRSLRGATRGSKSNRMPSVTSSLETTGKLAPLELQKKTVVQRSASVWRRSEKQSCWERENIQVRSFISLATRLKFAPLDHGVC